MENKNITNTIMSNLNTDTVFRAILSPILSKLSISKTGKIMIVDPSKNERFLMRNMLQNSGYEILEYEDADSAFKAFTEDEYNIIIMNFESYAVGSYLAMQKMRCWEMANKKRNTPIVAFGSGNIKTNQLDSYHSGWDGYLPKPATRDQINRVLDFVNSINDNYKISVRN